MTAAEGIPEGFHSTKPGRVAPKARERLSLGRPTTALTLFNPSDYLIFLSFTFPRIFLVQ